MKLSLYQITQKYMQTIEYLFDTEDNDINYHLIDEALNQIKGEMKEKSLNVAAFFQNLEEEVKTMRNYEDAMADRRRHLENKVNVMRDYLRKNMEASGISEIKGPEFVIKLRRSPPKVVIDNEEMIPQSYLDYRPKINKTAIKNAINEGVEVEGAHLECHNKSLIIK